MSRSSRDRDRFLDLLKETPFVSYVCKQMGLSRTTIFRWRKSNPEFDEKIDEALQLGRENINDMAETCLAQKVKEKDMPAIKFWLQANHPRYVPVRTTYVEPPSQKKRPRPGVPCKTCGHIHHQGFDPHAEETKARKKRKDLTKEILEMRHKREKLEEILKEFPQERISYEDRLKMWDVPQSLPQPTQEPEQTESVAPIQSGPGVQEVKLDDQLAPPPPLKSGVHEA